MTTTSDHAEPPISMPRVLPQLSVRGGRAAIEFYKSGFGAIEQYRIGGTDAHEAVVAQLSVGGATFWVADESPAHANHSPESLGGTTARMLLIVDDPRATVRRAVAAGATEVRPVKEEHQWLLGRIADPFGHHWEIGKPLIDWPPPLVEHDDHASPSSSSMAGDSRPSDEESKVFRPGGVSYLHIPSPEPERSTAFYQAAFDWSIREDDGSPAFEDGTGHVIGHFITDLPVAGDAGFLPYVYVENVDEALSRVTANGGTIVRPPFPEGELWVATVHDPNGNLLGLWQSRPRL
jgi:PhnB protein